MREAAATGFLNATDMADYLVTKGMPFREAHSCVGKAVSYALEEQKELHELSLDEFKKFSSSVEKDIFKTLATQTMIDQRRSFGGTATANVTSAIVKAKKNLKKELKALDKYVPV